MNMGHFRPGPKLTPPAPKILRPKHTSDLQKDLSEVVGVECCLKFIVFV